MKALSVRNPWASLIAAGKKTIELRTWRTKFRGEFVLVSSASKCPKEHADFYASEITEWPRGVTLAVCELVDVRPATMGDMRNACCQVDVEREFAWAVRVVRLLEQRPVKGRLGFWDIDPSHLHCIRHTRGARLVHG